MNNVTTGNKILGFVLGIVYIIFGIYVMNTPETTLLSLALFVGIALFVGGLVLIIDSFRLPYLPHLRSSMLTEGILLFVLGLIFLLGNVDRDVKILSYLLLFWFIATSALQIQFAIAIEKVWVKVLVIVINLFVIAYSVWFLFNPDAAAYLLVATTGVLFISSGINKIIVSL